MEHPESPAEITRSRDYEVFHSVIRKAWQFTLEEVVPALHARCEEHDRLESAPQTETEARDIIDHFHEFQVLTWVARHLQRIRYYDTDYGYFPVVERSAEPLLDAIEHAAAAAGEWLRLNPSVKIPDYLRWADFHQHRGGTWSDGLDGLIYETARQSAFLTESGDRNIYSWSYAMLPDRQYGRVLDWGTGHGSGILEFKRLHPEALCYGVDLSAPCLKLAHYRATQQGLPIRFSQQNLEELDFEDDFFDLAVHIFMWHEIPPGHLVKALKEIHRVLKPGGMLCGPESCLSADEPYLQVIQNTLPWLIDEVYFNAWHDFDLEYWARKVGFSDVRIEPWGAAHDTLSSERRQQINQWKYFYLIK
jgi:ubiquinone/menaquinone biosynthesis C-methylase UbiE